MFENLLCVQCVMRTYDIRRVHLVHHDDSATVVVVDHGPEVCSAGWEGHLSDNQTVSLLVALGNTDYTS